MSALVAPNALTRIGTLEAAADREVNYAIYDAVSDYQLAGIHLREVALRLTGSDKTPA